MIFFFSPYLSLSAPTPEARKAALDNIWNQLTENRVGEEISLALPGRFLTVPCTVKGIARHLYISDACLTHFYRFHFDHLCRQPLGAADYGKIATKFHTVLLDDIPKMDLSDSNEARRFITLIDELYQHGVKLICSSSVGPDFLFPKLIEKKGNALSVSMGEEEVFAFSRSVSRLNEMQTKQYLERKHHKVQNVE